MFECVVCINPYDGCTRCPRILRCGHTLCSMCITDLLADNAIVCPSCREITATNTIDDLPKNLLALQEQVKIAEKEVQSGTCDRLCEVCGEEPLAASSICLECNQMMCQDHGDSHTRHRALQNHRVVTLAEAEGSQHLKYASSVICPDHKEPFRFFDEQCGELVCRDCMLLTHIGHKCSSMTEAATRCRRETQTAVEMTLVELSQIQAADDQQERISEEINGMLAQQLEILHTTMEQVRTALTSQEQKLNTELTDARDAKQHAIAEQRSRLRICQSTRRTAIDSASRAIASLGDAQIILAKSEITQELKSLSTEQLPLQSNVDAILACHLHAAQLIAYVQQIGCVTSRRRLSVHPQDTLQAATSPSDKEGVSRGNTSGPKRPLSGYQLFCHDVRPQVKKEAGDSKVQGGLMKVLAERWGKLSDDEKRIYNDRAKQLKALKEGSSPFKEEKRDEGQNNAAEGAVCITRCPTTSKEQNQV